MKQNQRITGEKDDPTRLLFNGYWNIQQLRGVGARHSAKTQSGYAKNTIYDQPTTQ